MILIGKIQRRFIIGFRVKRIDNGESFAKEKAPVDGAFVSVI